MQTLIELFHADSLGGPMGELKKAFETKNPAVVINLTSGRSKRARGAYFEWGCVRCLCSLRPSGG